MGKIVLESRDFGLQLEQMVINLQQLRLSAAAQREELPITVVDISGLAPVTLRRDGNPWPVTPRRELMEIVDAVAVHNPAAIGVDVIFNPSASGHLTPDDSQFLEFCLALATDRQPPIPVFVGIFESIVLGPERWLGEERFAPLGTSVVVPHGEHHQPTAEFINGVTIRVDGRVITAESMSHALARVAPHRPITRRWLGRWVTERFPRVLEREQSRRAELLEAREFAIDFGPLQRFRSVAIPATSAQDVAGMRQRFENKIVLIGRGRSGQTTDLFTIPAESSPVAGVHVLAAATYTLLQAPLYRLTHSGRIVADIAVALVPLSLVLAAQLLYYRRSFANSLSPHTMFRTATISAAVAVFALGYFLVPWTGILWTDYLMVIGALLAHGPLEHLLKRGYAFLRRRTVHI